MNSLYAHLSEEKQKEIETLREKNAYILSAYRETCLVLGGLALPIPIIATKAVDTMTSNSALIAGTAIGVGFGAYLYANHLRRCCNQMADGMRERFPELFQDSKAGAKSVVRALLFGVAFAAGAEIQTHHPSLIAIPVAAGIVWGATKLATEPLTRLFSATYDKAKSKFPTLFHDFQRSSEVQSISIAITIPPPDLPHSARWN